MSSEAAELAVPYREVPKTLGANVEYRGRVLDWAGNDPSRAKLLWRLCKRDSLFWLNAFGYIFDAEDVKDVPFITYPHQDVMWQAMDECWNARQDLLVVKSRKQGASWLVMAYYCHRWLFMDKVPLGVMTHVERKMDTPDDSDSLFWKFDYLLRHLPKWMKPVMGEDDRTYMKAHNPETGAILTGSSSSATGAKGGRKAGMALDEFAFFNVKDSFALLSDTQYVCPRRIFISTFGEPAGAFYEMYRQNQVRQVILSWKDNPVHRSGLYKGLNGKLEILDKTYKFPADYPFVCDGETRSPFYDKEEERAPDKAAIKRELGMDPEAGGSPFFDRNVILQHQDDFGCDPLAVGELALEDTGEPSDFVLSSTGRLSLWIDLKEGKPDAEDGPYTIGVDTSAGTGNSNSVANVWSGKRGRKVAAFVSPDVQPHEHARMCMALGHWFSDDYGCPALIIAECNGGQNRQLHMTIQEAEYPNIYMRRNEAIRGAKTTTLPGWHNSTETKLALLLEYSRALQEGDAHNPDVLSLKESLQYQRSGRQVAHASAIGSVDPSGAGENHGDRVMGDALAWRGVKELQDGAAKPEEEKEAYGENTFGAYMERRRHNMARSALGAWAV